jgi:hypothetical protein
MWQLYFKVKGIQPGRVHVPGHGTLDFSSPDIPVDTCKELYESDFPYLKITQKGKEKLYGAKTRRSQSSKSNIALKQATSTKIKPSNNY